VPKDKESDRDAGEVTFLAEPGAEGEPEAVVEVEAAGEGEPDKGKKAEEAELTPRELKALHRELRQARGRIGELEASERHWSEVARAGQRQEHPPAEAGATGAPAEEEIDVIEALTSDGAKGLDRVLRKLGYARVEEIDQKIERTRAQITQDARLLGRFPDLGDEKSEFFALTAKRYEQLKGNKGIRESGMLMELAAELAEKDFATGKKAQGGGRRREREADDDDEGGYSHDRAAADEPENEEDRIERVRAQAGSRGRRPAREAEPNDDLSPLQKKIAAKLGVSEEAYRKRAKAGVRMSGLPRR
jgi:hypothetical protein